MPEIATETQRHGVKKEEMTDILFILLCDSVALWLFPDAV
jgi:hypothetical protein